MLSNDGSPLFNGVTSVDAYYHDDVVLTTDAVQRATWDDNSPMVASKANVFGVNYFPDDSFGAISGDYDVLLANAINVCTSLIFADGFESGDTTAWSNTVP
jgi:hypothetical protein